MVVGLRTVGFIEDLECLKSVCLIGRLDLVDLVVLMVLVSLVGSG